MSIPDVIMMCILEQLYSGQRVETPTFLLWKTLNLFQHSSQREREQQTGRKVIHRHIIQEFQKLKSFSSIDIIYRENICCTCLNENVPVHNQQLSVDLFIRRSISHFPHLNNTSLWGYSMSFFKTFSIYIFFYILNPFKPSRNACLEKSTCMCCAQKKRDLTSDSRVSTKWIVEWCFEYDGESSELFT